MGRMIDIPPHATSTDGHGTTLRINPRVFNPSQVDDEAVIANAQATGVVTTTSDRNAQSLFSSKMNRADYVGDICAAHDQARSAIDHRVVNLACFVVIRITRLDCAPA
jgi:hypothetical protein